MPRTKPHGQTLRSRKPHTVLHSPDDLYRLITPYVAGLDHEEAFGIYVNHRRAVLAVDRLAAGNSFSIDLPARTVYFAALKHRAAAYALCHNHPDGDPLPSDADHRFTDRLARIGNDLNIRLLDHLITGRETYYSFRQCAVERDAHNPFGPTLAYDTRWPTFDDMPYLGASDTDPSPTPTGTDTDAADTLAPPTDLAPTAGRSDDLEARIGYTVAALQRTVIADARPRINGPDDLYRLIAPYVADADREHFYGIYLSTKNHLLAVELVSLGSLSASLVHPREVYKPAILHSAGALAVAHNHPSGDPEPSAEDLAFTRRLAKAGELLGIKLLDHLVIGNGDYVSLKERGHF